MKALYTTANGRLKFELQAENVKDLFREVAQIEEIFDAEKKCGLCQSANIKPHYRETPDGYKFYELLCADCDAQFQFGQKKNTEALFPKRKEGTGGWKKYEGKPDDHEEAQPQRSAPRPASQPKTNGDVPSFKTWHDAEHSQHWGEKYLKIDEAGGMVKLTDDGAKYQAVNRPAPARA